VAAPALGDGNHIRYMCGSPPQAESSHPQAQQAHGDAGTVCTSAGSSYGSGDATNGATSTQLCVASAAYATKEVGRNTTCARKLPRWQALAAALCSGFLVASRAVRNMNNGSSTQKQVWYVPVAAVTAATAADRFLSRARWGARDDTPVLGTKVPPVPRFRQRTLTWLERSTVTRQRRRTQVSAQESSAATVASLCALELPNGTGPRR